MRSDLDRSRLSTGPDVGDDERSQQIAAIERFTEPRHRARVQVIGLCLTAIFVVGSVASVIFGWGPFHGGAATALMFPAAGAFLITTRWR